MTEIRFYHLEAKTLEQVLPQLLSKIYSLGMKILLKLDNAERVKQIDNLLWTYSPNSFLPHSAVVDENVGEQPIFITTEDKNLNSATVLILADGAEAKNIADFDICCEIFNGNDQEMLKQARAKWKKYKEQGFDVTYYQQDEKGVWQKKV